MPFTSHAERAFRGSEAAQTETGITGFAFAGGAAIALDTRYPEARKAFRAAMERLAGPRPVPPRVLTADERADLYRRFPNAEALADLDARLAKGAS